MSGVLALDWGARKIGWATSDSKGIAITPQGTQFRHTSVRAFQTHPSDIHWIKSLIDLYDIATVVLGLPLHADGEESPASTQMRNLAVSLEKQLEMKIILVDERWTSVDTESKGADHGQSAALILKHHFGVDA